MFSHSPLSNDSLDDEEEDEEVEEDDDDDDDPDLGEVVLACVKAQY